jgi:aspartate kinase
MSLIVQKFGGTSVADSEKILAAARKAIRARQTGHDVVLVVSAMGKETDRLVELAHQLCEDPPAREMDMLLSTGEQVSVALMAMAIHKLGHEAESLTGGQIGIRTDSTHTRARIQSISTERVRRLLGEGKIVIAAGFQGIDENLNITTLGRGGSDTTAVALAAVLEADACEIYTDVDGVYTTDPRILPEARKVARISYDEMLELASLGAGVMHSRSIEFGKKFSVPIHVRSSFSDVPGTVISTEVESTERAVCGATVTRDEARITIEGVPDRPGSGLRIFAHIAAENIPVDMIVQNVGEEGRADISFTVLKNDLSSTLRAVETAATELGARRVTHDNNVSKVSVVGMGMASQTGVAHRMFRALADAGINLLMITTSEIKISVLVSRQNALDAVRVVHREFELEQPPLAPARPPSAGPAPFRQANAVDVVTRLQAMEELTIEGITLDADHARVTLSDVPDQPGVAAELFESVSRSGIFVDMIVQSIGHNGLASLSFTVPRGDLEKSCRVAGEVAGKLGGRVGASRSCSKLSVAGIGMRSHTGVVLRTARSLSERGINVEMISTSEVQVNVVVHEDQAKEGYNALSEAFGDALR